MIRMSHLIEVVFVAKKWLLALFVWVPGIVVQNVWNIYHANKDADPTYNLLSFHHKIVYFLLQQQKTRMNS